MNRGQIALGFLGGFVGAILFGGLINLMGWDVEEYEERPQQYVDPSCHDLIGRLADEAVASYSYALGENDRGSMIDDDGMRLIESRLLEICING